MATDDISEIKKKYEKGLVFVHTGNGKGKTTAALGLALRAIGYGRKVLMIQFMKGRNYGELYAAEKYLPNLTLYKCGQDSFVMKNNPSQLDIELARKGLEMAKEAVSSGEYDMIILDEINVALDFNLIPLEEVIELIKNKPEKLDLGLTGRYAPKEIIELADLVTEMKEIKHPYSKGIPAREGFEY
ncbi:MAG: cob(I)yrinic acid a,c-diamide adenosyltransferase [Syntrophomonadaceae bacterium]